MWSDFVSVFQNVKVDGVSGFDVLSNSIVDGNIYSVFNNGIQADADTIDKVYDQTNIRFMYLMTSQKANAPLNSGTYNKNSGNYIFRDLSSHNLYFRVVNGDGTTNQYEYSNYFKNRIYAKLNAEKTGCTTKYEYSSSNGGGSKTIDFNNPTMLFNYKRYYYKSPENYVPLEIYSTGNAALGSLSEYSYDSQRRKMLENGKVISEGDSNFKAQILYSGRGGEGGNSTYNGNIIQPFTFKNLGKSDVGVFTALRTERALLYSDSKSNNIAASDFSNLFDDLFNGSDEIAANSTTLLDYFDYEMAKLFEKHYTGSSADADAFKDSTGTPVWSPTAARERVVYSPSSKHKSDSNVFNASICQRNQ